MKKLKLRCYVCGKEIDPKEFTLVSATPNATDRVFVVHSEDCAVDVGEDQPALVVRS